MPSAPQPPAIRDASSWRSWVDTAGKAIIGLPMVSVSELSGQHLITFVVTLLSSRPWQPRQTLSSYRRALTPRAGRRNSVTNCSK